ncbi:hypothetical protein D029_2123B, partial [Vibrio parahaemolyticus 970107]
KVRMPILSGPSSRR